MQPVVPPSEAASLPSLTHLDPWLKQPCADAPMDGASFVCQYDLPIEGVLTITEALFLAGGPRHWQLWSLHGEFGPATLQRILQRQAAGDPRWRAEGRDRGLAAAATLHGTPEEAAAFLFLALQRGHYPYTGATSPFTGGLLPAALCSALVEGLHAEWDRNRAEASAEAERNPPTIVLTALALGLSPRPAGHNATSWVAACPSGRGHGLRISAAENAFGCGYCRLKGGPEDLRRVHTSFHPPRP